MTTLDERSFYRIMLGPGSTHAEECFDGGFIGGDWGINQDLSEDLVDNWRDFNKKFRPVFLAAHPEKTKIAAGLACGMLWTICKGLSTDDVVLCPDGQGSYRIGRISGDYFYEPEGVLPHRRPVEWSGKSINRAEMSDSLRNSTGSIGTVGNITQYREEIAELIGSSAAPTIISTDETVEDPSVFALEKHLEDFLVKNWSHTELGQDYEVFEEDEASVGQQFPTDTGPIDILAIKKDKSELLVVELKKGRASDVVVGQILRYMGFVQEELAEAGQSVRGIIIALEDDQRLKRAMSMIPSIDFYRYEVSFKLHHT